MVATHVAAFDSVHAVQSPLPASLAYQKPAAHVVQAVAALSVTLPAHETQFAPHATQSSVVLL